MYTYGIIASLSLLAALLAMRAFNVCYRPAPPLFHDLWSDEKAIFCGRWYPAVPIADGRGHLAFVDIERNFAVVMNLPNNLGSVSFYPRDATPEHARLLADSPFEVSVACAEDTMLVIGMHRERHQFTLRAGGAAELYRSAADAEDGGLYADLCDRLMSIVSTSEAQPVGKWLKTTEPEDR